MTKENRTFKFVMEVVRCDRFYFRIMSTVYTFDYNFAMVTLVSISFILNLITVLNLLLAFFPPNSRFSQSFIQVPIYKKCLFLNA